MRPSRSSRIAASIFLQGTPPPPCPPPRAGEGICRTLPREGEGPAGERLTECWDDPGDQVDLDHGDDANSGRQDQAVADGAAEDLPFRAHPVDARRADREVLRADHLAHHA